MPRPAKRKASGPAGASRLRSKRRALQKSPPEPSEAPPTGFNSLPEEVILVILDFFLDTIYTTDQVRSLYSLSLTSRQLYRLSKPYLYSLVDNRIIEPRKLLRTLLQEPHMTDRVRNLEWFDDHGNLISCWKRKDKKYALTHIERRELCKKVEELGLSNPRMYSRGFQLQRPKDHLAALLLLCPNIRSLDVVDTNVCCYPRGYHIAPPWIRLLGEVGFGETQTITQHFQHLSAIRIRMGPIRLVHIPPILNIRSLRTLMLEDIFQPEPMSEWIWDFGVSPRSSPLENLYVQNSYIDSQSLAQIIHSIHSLRLFCFDFDNSVRNLSYTLYDDEFPELHYPTLAAALLEHSETLEQLSIADNADPELSDVFSVDKGTLGSLRSLDKVCIMDVDLSCFGGVDFDEETLLADVRPANLASNLPANLQYLDLNIDIEDEENLRYEEFWRKQILDDLLNNFESSLPRLKEVRLSRKEEGEIKVDEIILDRTVAFAEKGVMLTVPADGGRFQWALLPTVVIGEGE
ncbi:hypothetical protein K458DRAFT_400048 [Lentithecium fluviatile CBS 122367]|uniref:F-box domain-containing protein n=1 Tax=Lentithecium fluviatile CBS 122367 TaxID=1168545 RepID=A0A6G1JGI4_9PLEO|nr:hypothetical protein K458DRAFT_400048 [Lentithecium fluviatile CBS 122367]